MTLEFRVDSTHALEDLASKLLWSQRGWWSRNVFAVCDRERGISLHGTVASFYHKQLAQEAFRQFHPEITVCNDLKVAAE